MMFSTDSQRMNPAFKALLSSSSPCSNHPQYKWSTFPTYYCLAASSFQSSVLPVSGQPVCFQTKSLNSESRLKPVSHYISIVLLI